MCVIRYVREIRELVITKQNSKHSLNGVALDTISRIVHRTNTSKRHCVRRNLVPRGLRQANCLGNHDALKISIYPHSLPGANALHSFWVGVDDFIAQPDLFFGALVAETEVDHK